MSFAAYINEGVSRAIDQVQIDRSAGLESLRLLARAGDKSAIVHLGLYLSEDPSTTEEAVRWLMEAQDFDSAEAAWNLAMISREREDLQDMKRWIDRAAALGEPDAIEVRKRGYDVTSVLKSYE